MNTTHGTCYFRSKACAANYYLDQGFERPMYAVNEKLAQGEIHIGSPPLKAGETAILDKDGRYHISVEA